jgi:hypothetical protein
MRRMSHRQAAIGVLAIAIGLAACGGGQPSTSVQPVFSGSPSAEPPASPSPSVPSASHPQDPTGLSWTEAGRFAEDGIQLVTDVSAWSGGFLAIGQAWVGNSTAQESEPRVWSSPDGSAWSQVEAGLGTAGVGLRGILRLSTGGVMIVGRVPAGPGSGFAAKAWRSNDGQAWTAVDLPVELVGQIDVASGPIGHVISTGRDLWYSAEAESWRRVHRAPAGVGLRSPVAGDEGFVVPAFRVDGGGAPIVYASRDGLAWFEGTPSEAVLGVASWRGDWLGWGHTADPTTISILRSANGLDWSVALDVNDLTPPDGPKAGLGLESGITEVTLSGEGGVVAMTLGWNHCCVQPPQGVAVYVSMDGDAWVDARLPENTNVSSLATDGEVVVLGGHLHRGHGGAAFWVAER